MTAVTTFRLNHKLRSKCLVCRKSCSITYASHYGVNLQKNKPHFFCRCKANACISYYLVCTCSQAFGGARTTAREGSCLLHLPLRPRSHSPRRRHRLAGPSVRSLLPTPGQHRPWWHRSARAGASGRSPAALVFATGGLSPQNCGSKLLWIILERNVLEKKNSL